MKLEVTKDAMEQVFREGVSFDNRFSLAEESEWEDMGKFSTCELIIKDQTTSKYYRGYITRFGSSYNGYDFKYDTKLDEVVKKEVTKLEWVSVE